ncbi:MAG: integrin alpha [Planctomycetota bacterium]|nr:integrin alpha [Planctomycetota bacterium]
MRWSKETQPVFGTQEAAMSKARMMFCALLACGTLVAVAVLRIDGAESPRKDIGALDSVVASAPAGLDTSWWAEVQGKILDDEMQATLQDRDADGVEFATPRYHIVNRGQNLRAYYSAEDGLEFRPRATAAELERGTRTPDRRNLPADADKATESDDRSEEWRIVLKLEGHPVQSVRAEGKRIIADHGTIVESVENRNDGIEHSFLVREGPDGPFSLTMAIKGEGYTSVSKKGADGVSFAGPSGDLLAYVDLTVYDATGRELDARMRVDGRKLHLDVLESGEYPIYVDPLGLNPAWTADPTDQGGAFFGGSVSSAGDVNGDGYDDVIIGADVWDSGSYIDEGKAYVYHGGSSGLATTAAWEVDPTDQTGAFFGHSVSSAGDVNGDGYDDVIIGASRWASSSFIQEGKAYVYHGGPSGLATTAAWELDPTDQNGPRFGASVSSAGDVNGDGYDDVIIGAWGWDSGSNFDEGKAYVYHGGPSGLATTAAWEAEPADQTIAWFGFSVSSAGDVNADGFDDVIIGAPRWDGPSNQDEGKVYVYHGGPSGLATTAAWEADPTDDTAAAYGRSVSSAGDVNGDGYDDVIIGSSWTDASYHGEGRAYVYHGGPSGLATTAAWELDPTDQGGADFGFSVSSAGDVGGDGFDDVIVGARGWDSASNADEGKAFVYHGGLGGLATSAAWEADPTDQTIAWFGHWVSSAGDVNGDGYDDVIIGAPRWDSASSTSEGRAYVYPGAADAPAQGCQPQFPNSDVKVTPLSQRVQIEPHIIVDPMYRPSGFGTLYLIWQEGTGIPTADIMFSRSMTGGSAGSWSMAKKLNNNTTGVATGPHIAVDQFCATTDGTLWAVWETGSTNKKIVATASTDRGFNWSTEVVVDPSAPAGTNQRLPRVAVRDDKAWIVWDDDRNGGPDIFLVCAQLVGGALTFSVPVIVNNLPAGGRQLRHPDVDVPTHPTMTPPNVHVVWEENVSLNNILFATSASYCTNPPPSEKSLPLNGAAVRSEAVLTSIYDSVYVTYSDDFWSGNVQQQITFQRSLDKGATWGAEVRVDPTTTVDDQQVSPEITYTIPWQSAPVDCAVFVAAHPKLYIGWFDTRLATGTPNLLISCSTDGGATWSNPPVRINDVLGTVAGRPRTNMSIAGDIFSNQVYAAWADTQGGTLSQIWVDVGQ